MNTRRRRLQRMRKKHRGWKVIRVPWFTGDITGVTQWGELPVYDPMGIHFVYSRDAGRPLRDMRV